MSSEKPPSDAREKAEALVSDITAHDCDSYGCTDDGRAVHIKSKVERATALLAAERQEGRLEGRVKERIEWSGWGIIEIAVHNGSVSDYMKHWEGRTEKAESELASLQRRVTYLQDSLEQTEEWQATAEATLAERDAEIAKLREERDHWHTKAVCYGGMVHGCEPALKSAGITVDSSGEGGAVVGIAEAVTRLADRTTRAEQEAASLRERVKEQEEQKRLGDRVRLDLFNAYHTEHQTVASLRQEVERLETVLRRWYDYWHQGSNPPLNVMDAVEQALGGIPDDYEPAALSSPPAEPPDQERIVAAAIRRDGVIFTGPHHHQIFRYMVPMLGVKRITGEQGFVASRNRFVGREEGARIAFASGQIKEEQDTLFSESLWSVSDWFQHLPKPEPDEPLPAAAPTCHICGKPATCIGQYESAEEESPACDDCCGHGCEDGKCRPVAPSASPEGEK